MFNKSLKVRARFIDIMDAKKHICVKYCRLTLDPRDNQIVIVCECIFT